MFNSDKALTPEEKARAEWLQMVAEKTISEMVAEYDIQDAPTACTLVAIMSAKILGTSAYFLEKDLDELCSEMDKHVRMIAPFYVESARKTDIENAEAEAEGATIN